MFVYLTDHLQKYTGKWKSSRKCGKQLLNKAPDTYLAQVSQKY